MPGVYVYVTAGDVPGTCDVSVAVKGSGGGGAGETLAEDKLTAVRVASMESGLDWEFSPFSPAFVEAVRRQFQDPDAVLFGIVERMREAVDDAGRQMAADGWLPMGR